MAMIMALLVIILVGRLPIGVLAVNVGYLNTGANLPSSPQRDKTEESAANPLPGLDSYNSLAI